MNTDHTESGIRLSHLAGITVSGPDAHSFLQSQLSSDMNACEPGQLMLSSYLNPQGRVLAVLLVAMEGEDFLLITDSTVAADLVTTLSRYILRSKVTLSISETPVTGFCGNGASSASRHPLDNQRSFSSSKALAVSKTNDPTDAKALSKWREQDIMLGLPWIEKTTSGKHLAQSLGLDRLGAVSFEKGCFPGQEIVARLHYLGRAKEETVLIKARGDVVPNAGTTLLSARGDDWIKAGEVLNSIESEEIFTILAVIKRSALPDPGPDVATALKFDGNSAQISAIQPVLQ